MRFARRFFQIGLLVGLAFLPLGLAGAAAPAPAEAALSGTLTVVWGDAPGGQHTPPQYRLHLDDGRIALLLPTPGAGWSPDDLLAARGQRLRVSGGWVSPAARGDLPSPADLYQAERIERADGAVRPADAPQVFGAHPWISVLCRFSDIPATPRDQAYFQEMYANAPGRLDHYWRAQSYGLANVAGSSAVGWVDLPQPRAAYDLNGDPRQFDLNRAAQDCTAAVDGQVDFSQYDGINLMFNAALDGYAWGGQHWFNAGLDGKRYFYVAWVPPFGYTDITVIQHEMGHGFGMSHSSSGAAKSYDNAFDVMSDSWQGCYTTPAFRDRVYGCMGQGTIADHRKKLGWLGPDQIETVEQGRAAEVSLGWLEAGEQPAPGYRMIRIPLPGGSRYYTVELRGYVYQAGLTPWPGYDQKFRPILGAVGDQAVVIHQVDPARESPAHIIDQDGNGNTADAGAYFLPGESYTSPDGLVSIRVLALEPGQARLHVSNGLASSAPQRLQISGPTMGVTNQEYTFTASVLPLEGAAPITYTWTAAGQPSVMHVNGVSDAITLSWEVSGTQALTVTAINALGALTQGLSFPVLRPDAAPGVCPLAQHCLLLAVVMR